MQSTCQNLSAFVLNPFKLELLDMQIQERTRYSDEELEEFHLLITEKLQLAQQQLDSYMSQLVANAEGADSKVRGLDDGTGTSATEHLQNLAARQQKHVRHLENALIRISNKVYGVCRETGKLISKERLMAVPHATLSIQAKNNR